MSITKSFRKDACRTCPILYRELQTFFETDRYQSNLEKIKTIRPLPVDHSFREIVNRNFIYPPDLFHDFSSNGIIQRVMGCLFSIFYQDVLVRMISETSRTNRNQIKFRRLRDVMLTRLKAIHHRNGMINEISEDCVIHGTGSQQIDFFLLFGYLDTTIDRRSEEWQIYKLIREIYIFFDADSIRRSEMPEIERCYGFAP